MFEGGLRDCRTRCAESARVARDVIGEYDRSHARFARTAFSHEKNLATGIDNRALRNSIAVLE